MVVLLEPRNNRRASTLRGEHAPAAEPRSSPQVPATLERTGGLCRPCFKKHQFVENSQVFISYRRAEAAAVRRMLGQLETALPSMTFFLDTARLESARRWSDGVNSQGWNFWSRRIESGW
jgi:hypothetical protein